MCLWRSDDGTVTFTKSCQEPVLQGRMVKLGEILDAGILVQERKAPADMPVTEPLPAPAVPPRPGRLSLKARAS